MDSTQALIEPDAEPPARADGECPRCGEPPTGLPPVVSAHFDPVPLRRCARCGTRYTTGDEASRFVFSCSSCGLPFLSEALLPHAQHGCPDCLSGRIPADLPDPALARATEREVRAALAVDWKFVSGASVSAYLDRVVRQIARRLEGASTSRVVLFDDEALRTLALPSGILLVSLGTLSELHDEAELCFVLGHELAHAASGDAAVRLVRLGFQAVAARRRQDGDGPWGGAAADLMKLGYGRHRERDADARSLEALLALGYDPQSALRYLQRLHERIQAGDPRLRDLSLAHPTPLDRARRLERHLFGRVAPLPTPRSNREVFRRATASASVGGELVRSALPVDLDVDPETGGPGFWTWVRWGWVALAGLLLLLLVLGGIALSG